jgi:dissimilatory sulfite reductase (desulfoviridin) alpha/beta subunit
LHPGVAVIFDERMLLHRASLAPYPERYFLKRRQEVLPVHPKVQLLSCLFKCMHQHGNLNLGISYTSGLHHLYDLCVCRLPAQTTQSCTCNLKFRT